ncbi:hypothetical protein NE562_14445 [Butyricicoccus faecihominis]|uniref:hyaluronate lyase N-terminal domain-containing protein n=1 Tax=Butyricicoccus faecihominis TaxID=1712515 RepID=UPI00247959ED|nr:hypothetical protein [Butyricicoccus faecihominis]MCQ5130861.1 hypothetical protein [Butyricicoccus faecihominis]
MRTIQIKRGTAANTPTLVDGELGLQTDAGKLLVGNSGANLPVTMDADLDAVKTEIGGAIAGRALANHTHTAEQVGARPSTWTPSKADIGLGNVDNTGDGQKSVNYAGTAGNTSAVGGRAAGTVLAEIDGAKTSVANGKAQVASAISDKGVGTSAGADYGTMANNIRAIKTWTKWSKVEGFTAEKNSTVDISRYLFVFVSGECDVLIDVQNGQAITFDTRYGEPLDGPIHGGDVAAGYGCTCHLNAKSITATTATIDWLGVY